MAHPEDIIFRRPRLMPKEKGRFIQVVYSKTIQQEDYQPCRVEITSTVGEGEDIEDVFKDTRDMVHYLLGEHILDR